MLTELETHGLPPRIGTTMKPHEYVKRVRLECGLTQQAFADALGIHLRTIRRYEANEYPISRRSLMAIKAFEAQHKSKRGKNR